MRHARPPSRPSRHHTYFERIAADLWDGKWETIIATRYADDRERLFIEATILCRYGKSLSLRGSAEKVRHVLAEARRGAVDLRHGCEVVALTSVSTDDLINPHAISDSASLAMTLHAQPEFNESTSAA